MNPLPWVIERVFDVVWPAEGGDPEVPFRQKAAAFVVIVLTTLFDAPVPR
jgi:hypothetical protein